MTKLDTTDVGIGIADIGDLDIAIVAELDEHHLHIGKFHRLGRDRVGGRRHRLLRFGIGCAVRCVAGPGGNAVSVGRVVIATRSGEQSERHEQSEQGAGHHETFTEQFRG